MNSDRLYSIFLHVALVGLLILVGVLAIQNRNLKSPNPLANLNMIAVGDTIQLSGLVAVGDSSAFLTAGQYRLVFFMTTTCPFCQQNIPAWDSLVHLLPPGFPVAAVSMDTEEATRAYVKQQGIRYPVFVPNDVSAFRENNKIYGVPRTIVVDKENRVAAMWLGTLNSTSVTEVFASLP